MKHQIYAETEIETDSGIAVKADAWVRPGQKGRLCESKDGPPEPDDPIEVDILSVWRISDGSDVSLTEREHERLIESLIENALSPADD